MPFFEAQRETTELVQDSQDVVEESLQPSLVPAEQANSQTIDRRTEAGGGSRLPSRKTRPINWKTVLCGALLSCSAIVAVSVLVTDTASRNYACGLFDQLVLKDYQSAVKSFSKAIDVRKDPTFYFARADGYNGLQPAGSEDELRDLISATESGSHLPAAFRRAAILALKLGHREMAISINGKLADLSVPPFPDRFYFRDEAAYNLLLLDDERLAVKIASKIKIEVTKDLGSESAVQAMIFRETGRTEAARKIASKNFSEYCGTFCTSERMKETDGSIVPKIIETLMLLDQGKVEDAKHCVAKIESTAQTELNAYPIINLLRAWISYDEGKLDKCLKLTQGIALDQSKISGEKQDGEDEDSGNLSDSLEGLSLKTAAHLLREHVFMEKKDMKQAAIEQRNYLNTHCSGKVFVPFPFRKWLAEE